MDRSARVATKGASRSATATKSRASPNARKQFTSNAVVVLVVVPILAIFFLADGGRIAEAFIQLTPQRKIAKRFGTGRRPERHAQEVHQSESDSRRLLTRVLCRSDAFCCGFRTPSGLSFLGGVLEFMPVAGWMISASTIIERWHSHSRSLDLDGCAIEHLENAMDYFISPRVLGQNLEVHPLLVIFAMMVGARNRWNRGHLPFDSSDGSHPCHLAKIFLPDSAGDTGTAAPRRQPSIHPNFLAAHLPLNGPAFHSG